MDNPKKYILALDQGTTSSRAVLFDQLGKINAIVQREFEQIFPKPGWVEHNPQDLWSTQVSVAAEVIAKAGITGRDIAGIGITNQRETTLVWDRTTGKPIYNAIVWQDRRTATFCNELKDKGLEKKIREKTGLVIDAYFSATKIKWILDNLYGVREKAQNGDLCFGTVDSWLVWNLTRGKQHITDVSNASRTMLYNIHSMDWDQELLDLFDIPKAMLPSVKQSSEVYAETATTLFASKIPIAGIAGDQQAALFGQLCLEKGHVKSTYGTGCFLVMNTGSEIVTSANHLISTIAWQYNHKTVYALEGSVFTGGAAVQWLRDGLKIIKKAPEVERLAATENDNGGVYFVPALSGLGAPYWDQNARGAIFGLTRGTTDGHLARAALESIAFQVHDVLRAMEADTGKNIAILKVDGGAVVNNLLMQFQADLLGCKVSRPKNLETTAMGAAFFAGLAVGFWPGVHALAELWRSEHEFVPNMEKSAVDKLLHNWQKAVSRSKAWAIED
ncbi:MAG: glycerol kinase GlpK [Cyclobacteriaceae bacterium]